MRRRAGLQLSTTQTLRREPPFRFPNAAMDQWHLETQRIAPMNEVDTSGGSYSEEPPEPGLQGSTGATAQNQEITYVKTSADGNVFTLAGSKLPLGPYTLTAQGDVLKIKSNGTVWYRSN